MAEEGLEERTEEATPQRRDEFRKEGRVFQSRELVGATLLLATTLSLQVASNWTLKGMWTVFQSSYQNLSQMGHKDWNADTAMSMATFAIKSIAMLAGPIAVVGLLAAIFATLVQTGIVWTTKPFELDPDKLNPMRGLQRMFSMDSVVEMLKAFFKFAVAATVVYTFLSRRILEAGKLWDVETAGVARYLVGNIVVILVTVAGAMLVVAGVDYFYQRFRHEQRLRMTKQELREERRQSDGNPQVRARIRSIQRKIATTRMVEAVKTADVVITNPTHIAVALLYDRENMLAPKVVAKGADLLAERIKKIAREAGVPCVENVPLARALYKALKIGQFISRDLYNTVAEVLAYVYKLKGKTEV